MATVDSLLSEYIGVIECFGGLFLFCFSIYSLLNKVIEINSISGTNVEEKGLIKTYIFSTIFAFANPKSMIIITVLILESGVLRIHNFTVSLLAITILGIFFGSSFWWLLLVSFLSFLKKILSYTSLIWLNRAFAVEIAFSGLFIAVVGTSKIWLFSHSVLCFFYYFNYSQKYHKL